MSRNQFVFKSISCFGLMASLWLTGCQKQVLSTNEDEAVNRLNQLNAQAASVTTNAVVEWNQERQRIDGFGAFGGRIVPFFESPKRDSILDYLWGNSGLKLNILRGKALHTYPFNQQNRVVTIKPAGVDIDVAVSSPAYQALSADAREHLGQLWILKKAKERFQVPVIIASTWTPPLYMKTNPNSISGKWFNGLNLNTSSTLFARYLAGFAKAYQNEGITINAISPTNEPENVFSDWDASYWASNKLGEFVTNNLRPALNEEGLQSTKIIASENAAWGTANTFLSGMDRSNVDILAGHGYVEITELIGGKRGFNQSPSKWTFSTGGKPMWVTEASDDGGNYDAGIEGGLKLAVNMHKLLADCDASAYVFWLGMLAFQNNEALICTRSDGSLEFTKAYDVMGHYSRFIKANYKRINVAVQNANGLLISAYKDPQTGKFAMVVTNTGSSSVPLDINLSGFVGGQLSNYQTTATSVGHWGLAGIVAPTASGVYSLTIPAKSVSTLEGTKQ